MQLSEQVITLEQAKKLKELWFERDSLRKIEDEYQTIHQIWRDYLWDLYRANNDTLDWWEWYNAYTVSELMDYLLRPVEWYDLKVIKTSTYEVYYGHWVKYIDNQNLAQALWDMLIYLIENKYIDVMSEK